MKTNATIYSKIVSFKKRYYKKPIVPVGVGYILDNFFNNLHNFPIIFKDTARDFVIVTKDTTRDFMVVTKDTTRELKKKTKIGFFDKIDIFIFYIKSIYEIFYLILTAKPISLEKDQEAMKNINKIIVNSDNVLKRVNKFYNRDANIIHPPIPVNKFYSSPNEKLSKSYWLSVNRLTPEKRIEMQIEAFNNLNENLIIVGGSNESIYAEDLKKSAKQNINFTKDVDEYLLRDLYAGAKGFITTSLNEDFGMTVVEAMAAGKPVIAPNEGGYKESLINNQTGILIDEIDSEKITEAIQKINKKLEDNASNYSDACQLQARKFDTTIFLEKIKQEVDLLFEKKKSFKKENIAVAIFSFDRPKYLKKVLRSLEKNTDLEGLDFYLFQDGAINKFSGRVAARKIDVEKCISLWNDSLLPNKRIIQNHYNNGIAITQFEAKVRLFEDYKYEQVIFFEDDMLVSKNYIKLLRVMLNQFRSDNNISVVMCNGGEPTIRTKKESINLLHKLRTGNDNLWGWAMWRDRWQLIKPTFLKYYKFVENIDYKDRNVNEIKDFFKEEHFLSKSSSQDVGMKYAFDKNELIELNTYIHRGKYIGKIGVHMTPYLFRKKLHSKIKFYDFEEDLILKKFDDYDKERFVNYTRSILRG